MMFPFKAMIICKIQLRTENQLGKGQEEKVLLPFSRYKMQPNTELQSHCQVFLGTNIQKEMDLQHNEYAGFKEFRELKKDHGILLREYPTLVSGKVNN